MLGCLTSHAMGGNDEDNTCISCVIYVTKAFTCENKRNSLNVFIINYVPSAFSKQTKDLFKYFFQTDM